MYKQALQMKLRFDIVGAGRLTTEQLFTASLEGLLTAEEELQVAVEKLGSTSRRAKLAQGKEVEEMRLKLSILTDVIDTRVKEEEDRRNAASNKAHNQKILTLIAEKKDEELKGMTTDQLEALLK